MVPESTLVKSCGLYTGKPPRRLGRLGDVDALDQGVGERGCGTTARDKVPGRVKSST